MKTYEADIRIGQFHLTYGQAMTVRVALNDFLFTLNDPDHDLGAIRDGYRDRVHELLQMIHENMKEQEYAEQDRIS